MKQEVLIGQTDYTVLILVRDSSTGAPKTALTFESAGIDVCYTRVETDNDVVLTDGAPVTTTLTGAHVDWGFVLVDNTKAPGLYKLDIADGVFATGAWSAVVSFICTGCDPVHLEFVLVPEAPVNGVKVNSIADDKITADAFAADSIVAATLATGVLTADAFAADAIVAATLNTGCITADAFAANAIVAATLNADCITEAKIADNALANEHFAAGALTSAEITSAAGCVVASIANDAITAAAIANGAIDAATFAADMDAEIAAIVWNAAVASYGGAGTYGQAAEDILADTNELQTDDTPASISAVKTVVDLIEDIVRNQMEVTDADGAVVLRADNGTDALYTVAACITDNSTTTIRKRLA